MRQAATPHGSMANLRTNPHLSERADAGRVGPKRSAPVNVPSEICLTELGVSGQRRLSVGGAITRFRHRSLGDPRVGQATGTRKAARGYAATVGFRRAKLRFAQERTSAIAACSALRSSHSVDRVR